MVTTRSQKAKQKAAASPSHLSPAPKASKQSRVGGADAAAAAAGGGGQDNPLLPKQLNTEPAGTPLMGLKLSKAREAPFSHPLQSLPTSPASRSPDENAEAGAGGSFRIAAAPQQQPAPAVAAPSPPTAADAAAGAGAAGAEPETEPRAVSVEPAGPAQEQQPPAPLEQQQPPLPAAAAVWPAAVAAAEKVPLQAAEPAAAAVPAAAPRLDPTKYNELGERLLKPLPEQAEECTKLPDGPEPTAVEVEYPLREQLQPLEAPAAALEAAQAGMAGSDWVETLRALGLLRQLAVHHPDTCSPQLGELVALVLRSVRSLRSSVCKTAVMTVSDLYLTFGGAALEAYTDVGGLAVPTSSLLAQMLLKCSSNDKRFVIEEAQRALQTMADTLAPAAALGMLCPYAEQHKNPKVRGKAGGALAEAASRMQPDELASFGFGRLLQLSAKLLNDNSPDAREAAKRLLAQLRSAFGVPEVAAQLLEGAGGPEPAAAAAAAAGAGEGAVEDGEAPPRQPSPWERYCQGALSVSAALAVLKVTGE